MLGMNSTLASVACYKPNTQKIKQKDQKFMAGGRSTWAWKLVSKYQTNRARENGLVGACHASPNLVHFWNPHNEPNAVVSTWKPSVTTESHEAEAGKSPSSQASSPGGTSKTQRSCLKTDTKDENWSQKAVLWPPQRATTPGWKPLILFLYSKCLTFSKRAVNVHCQNKLLTKRK